MSPLLANVYLHYVLDLWADWWRNRKARGDVIIVRWADDFIVGFEHRGDAEKFLAGLRERFAKFGLELHPGKTWLIEFGRFAVRNRAARGEGKPETFDFLGFTHICATAKGGQFWVKRITIAKRMRAKLKQVKDQLWRRMHRPFRCRAAGWPAWCAGTWPTTACLATARRSRPSVTRSPGTGSKRCGVAARRAGA